MALSDRREVLIVHNSAGTSVLQNVWAWKAWGEAASLDIRVWDSDITTALQEMDLSDQTCVWFADARYIPHPSAAYAVVRKKLPDEPGYVVFAAGEPMAAHSFYEEKFTAKDDVHDKFGGLRYIDVTVSKEAHELDKTWNGKDVEFATYRPTRLGFPYAVFMLHSNEPAAVVEKHQIIAEAIYPHITRYSSEDNILESHRKLALASDTQMFLVLDADFVLEEALTTEELKPWEHDSVHLWYARNPVNGLVYGHGGPKAFNRDAFHNLTQSTVDVTTSAQSKRLIVHEQCVGVHEFNWSMGSAWRTAFREAAKLVWGKATAATKKELQECTHRLDVWTSENDLKKDVEHADFALAGARAGRAWAQRVNKAAEAIRINDFDWLHQMFNGYLITEDLPQE